MTMFVFVSVLATLDSSATTHSAQPSAGIVFRFWTAIPGELPWVPTAPVGTRGQEVAP